MRPFLIVAALVVFTAGCSKQPPVVKKGDTAASRDWHMVGPMGVPGGDAAVFHSVRPTEKGSAQVLRDVLVVLPDGRNVTGSLTVDCASGIPSWKGPIAQSSPTTGLATGLAGSVIALGCRPAEGPVVNVASEIAKLTAANEAERKARQDMLAPR